MYFQMNEMKDIIIKEKDAEKAMKDIEVMPGGIKIMKDKCKTRLIKLSAVSSPMANLIKEEMLAVGGDAAVHKLACACKVETTGVLLIGNLNQYKRFILKMNKQPFGAKEIAKRLKKVLTTNADM